VTTLRFSRKPSVAPVSTIEWGGTIRETSMEGGRQTLDFRVLFALAF
jgi:hypothetical protein